MFTPAIFTRNHNFWRDPFDEFNEMFPELPGFAKEDIHVDLKDDILTISASHNEEKKEEDKNTKYIRKERHSASYSRSFRVANVTHEDISAAYNNGVLTVTFPKRETLPEKETKKIEIK